MADFRTLEEKISDHLELAGYATVALAAGFSLVYFAMIFFYDPVRRESVLIQAAFLTAGIVLMGLGFGLPAHKNLARILARWSFLALAVVGYFKLEQKQWWYALLLVFAVYSHWVLSHPVGIRFFRALRPWEERLAQGAGWLTWHQTVLKIAAVVLGLRGLQALLLPSETVRVSQESAWLELTQAGLLWVLVSATFRLQAWARYLLAAFLAVAMLLALPATVSTESRSYLAYWQSLGFAGYCGITAAALFFSPAWNRLFKTRKPAAKTVNA